MVKLGKRHFSYMDIFGEVLWFRDRASAGMQKISGLRPRISIEKDQVVGET